MHMYIYLIVEHAFYRTLDPPSPVLRLIEPKPEVLDPSPLSSQSYVRLGEEWLENNVRDCVNPRGRSQS